MHLRDLPWVQTTGRPQAVHGRQAWLLRDYAYSPFRLGASRAGTRHIWHLAPLVCRSRVVGSIPTAPTNLID